MRRLKFVPEARDLFSCLEKRKSELDLREFGKESEQSGYHMSCQVLPEAV